MLDEPSIIGKIDPKGMISQIESLPEQIMESQALVKALGKIEKPGSIMMLGMGGSGIAGDILKDWLFGRTKIPITVNKNLTVPRVDSDVLLVAISYSGNTKETLLALDEGLKKTDNVVCITSGGKMLEVCSKKGLRFVKVPAGYQPRCALGYLFGSLAHITNSAGVYNGLEELEEACTHLKGLKVILVPNQTTPNNPAKKFALKLKDHTPVVYAYKGLSACANRWHTQLNENAKMLAWWGILPEMTHNEIVGWDADDRAQDFAMVFLRDKDEPDYIKNRFTALKKLIDSKIFELWSEGRGRLTRMLHLIYYGDFISYYLAILRGVDPMPVRIIEKLKKED